MSFGAIGVHACPAVTKVEVEPKVICVKNGSATVHIEVDWTDPSRLPWDKNHTIEWWYRLSLIHI